MIAFDYPDFTCEGVPFVPLIYDAGLGEPIPDGFNAVRIPLDGGLRSNLRWKAAFEYAEQAADQGLKLVWDLDLGLFSRLAFPLADETQFRTLAFAVQHLLTQIRERFLPLTLGVVLYRGSLDFTTGFPWDRVGRERTQGRDARSVRLDCRTHCLGYLRQLIVGWPDAIQPMVLLDAYRVRNPLDILLLTDRQHYQGFVQLIKGSDLPGRTVGWDRASLHGVLARHSFPVPVALPPVRAICLPHHFPSDYDFLPLETHLMEWVNQQVPFRVITEEHLTVDWDGLDQIAIPEGTLSASGHRKLQGFLAAGGQTFLI